MLVLTRKIGEQVVVTPPGVNDKLIVTVDDIRDAKVRIRFEFSEGWEVLRKEVWDRLHDDDAESI